MKKPIIEIYSLTKSKQYCKKYAHTDNIEFLEGTIMDGTNLHTVRKYKKDIILDRVMDYNEYTSSVEANTEPTDERDYPVEGIRVIILDF